MRIGVPREIKTHEYRVGLTPAGVSECVHHGHGVMVETDAGEGLGASDADYRAAGAVIARSAAEVFGGCDLVIKVKEPQPAECRLLGPGQVLFAFLHLAADPVQAELLLKSGCSAIAYETVTDAQGRLPLLAPMSEVAGRMAVQVGAHALEREQGGRGVLLSGVPGVPPADVVVLGAGVAGSNAVRMAVGLGARVTVIDRSLDRLTALDERYGARITTQFSTRTAIEAAVIAADLVIGAVLVPGAAAPRLVTRDMVRRMRPGAVIIDIAIDQGGCCETSRPTTHAEPTYLVEGVVHYCVTNMPGAVARTSALALTNATLPFALTLADRGLIAALSDHALRAGLNIHRGHVTSGPVAQALGLPWHAVDDIA